MAVSGPPLAPSARCSEWSDTIRIRPETSAAAAESSVGESAQWTSSRRSGSRTVRFESTSCATSRLPATAATTGDDSPHDETAIDEASFTLKSDLTLAGHGRSMLPSTPLPSPSPSPPAASASAAASVGSGSEAPPPPPPPDDERRPPLAALARPRLEDDLSSRSETE